MASSKILTNYTAKSNCTKSKQMKSKHQINPNPIPGPKQREIQDAFMLPDYLLQHFLHPCTFTSLLAEEPCT
jgi:hypothetical protein